MQPTLEQPRELGPQTVQAASNKGILYYRLDINTVDQMWYVEERHTGRVHQHFGDRRAAERQFANL